MARKIRKALKPTQPQASDTLPTPAVLATPVVNELPPQVNAEQIARRAYELFLARGGVHGFHDQDWRQAERELTARA